MGKDYMRHRRCLARVSLRDHVNAYVFFIYKPAREALVLSARDMEEKERRQYERR
jgi:uncharacterized DUF497 family protein